MNQFIDIDKVLGLLKYDSSAPLIFNSGLFLFLFLAFTLLYYLLRKKDTARILFVTLFSYYFYYKSSGMHFLILAVVTMSDYLIAGRIAQVGKTRGKWLIALSLLVDLGMLAYFKYTNFLIQIWNGMSGMNVGAMDIVLPVGISFFTFQSLSYTIDVYRRNIKPLDRLLDYAFYVSFFPQLVAGPIVRARDFIPQIHSPRVLNNEMMSRAVFLIIIGLIKKAVISDYISLNFVDRIFEQPNLYSGIENLLGIYGYTLQIYCDFSGYSDMAIGIALLLGYEFPINFDSPYKSASITEFWRRWHISLSSWLRDYLYISMGGNRKGKFRTYVNLMLTMLIGGLWHGASLNFVCWGGLHGLFLVIERMLGIGKKKSRGIVRLVRVVITFNLVAFAWLFFRNTSFENSLLMVERVFGNFNPQLFPQVIKGYSIVMGLIAVGFVAHWMPAGVMNGVKRIFARTPLVIQALLMVLAVWVVIQVKSSEIQPFIYFQF